MENWKMKARCLDADPEIFFPPEGVNIRMARAVCLTCPVQEECLEYAIKNRIEYGVWGGLSTSQRGIIAKRMRVA